MSRRGLALILVVGVLGVLAVLGSAFAVLSRLEGRAARQRVHATQAFLLARSGIEDAQARLDLGQDGAYGGEDWNGDGILNGIEALPQNQVFRPGVLDVGSCPIDQALRPSFFHRDNLGKPLTFHADGRQRGSSGSLQAGNWSLKASPASGIFVNGGSLDAVDTDGDGVPNHRDPDLPAYHAVLRRILGTLAEAIDREDAADDGLPADQADGWKLLDLRPAGGWRSWEQVRDVALGGGQAKLDALKPYLTLSAWVDKKVVTPNAASLITAPSDVDSWAEIKRAHLDPLFFSTTTPPDFERVKPAPNYKVLGRAPVDLAWARHRRPALIALLGGLKGFFLDERHAQGGPTVNTAGTPPRNDCIGALSQAEIRLDWTQANDDCRRVADRILASTSDLRTWAEWNAFCDTLPSNLATGLTGDFPDQVQAKRDLLKANFNPNTDLNKLNPDPAMARLVDKSDLLVYSTEFNLTPAVAGDTFTAFGRVMGQDGACLARRTLTASTGGRNRLLRLTTQREFVAENLGKLDEAGDESSFRSYGSSPYITQAQGSDGCFGHAMTLGASGYLVGGGSKGVSLQTGPEPHTVWAPPASGSYAKPASYDGQIRLATLEQGTDPSLLFLARWGETLDADLGANRIHTPVGGSLEGGLDSTTPLYGNPSVGTPPGMLYPDGVYLEKGNLADAVNPDSRSRMLAYACAGNMPPSRGTISFWVKPSYDKLKSAWRNHRYVSNSRRHNGSWYAVFWLADHGTVGIPPSFSAFYRGDYVDNLDSLERGYQVSPSPAQAAHRWRLFTFRWDMTSAASGGTMCADRGTGANTSSLALSAQDAGTVALDFTQPDEDGTAYFYLGRGLRFHGVATGAANAMAWPDATFDEFAIYDFGTDPVAAQTATQALATARFQSGRYYKESAYAGLGAAGNQAGEWFSAPIRLDAGSVKILSLAWTQIVPRGLRKPAVSVKEDGDAGADGRILIELADGAGAGYLDGIPRTYLDPASSGVGTTVSSPFRLHAVFQPNLDTTGGNDLTRAILDPLVLDDISVLYRSASAPALTSWREGE